MHSRIERLLKSTATPFREIRHAEIPGLAGPADLARALACPLDRITKTLFMKVDRYVLLVLAVNRRVDFKALSEVLGRRPQMASTAELAATIDYPPLSVSPLACGSVPVLLDSALTAHEWVLIGSGELATEIEIRVSDLIGLTGARMCFPLASCV
jgi:prolyl-tRNA editing enzyme YbaK/EbsC (Cys-tRNA(Pro) deacylase)